VVAVSDADIGTSFVANSLVSMVVVASRPVGGVLSAGPEAGSGGVAIHLRGLPGDIGRVTRPTFGLAPGGVYQADQVAPVAGALLPRRFTLARGGVASLRGRFVFCGTFPGVAPAGR